MKVNELVVKRIKGSIIDALLLDLITAKQSKEALRRLDEIIITLDLL